jgi:hypothetical protein
MKIITHKRRGGVPGVAAVFALLLAAAMLLTLAPFAAVPAYAAIGNLQLGGSSVGNLSGNLSGAGYTWTASTSTLELTGGTYTSGRIFLNTADPVKLVFNGNVTIVTTGVNSAINANGNLEISGTGTLTASSTVNAWPAIGSSGSLEIKSGTVIATTTGDAPAINASGNVIISGTANVTATANASGGRAVYSISGSVSVAEGASLAAEGFSHGIYAPDGGIAINTSGTVTAKSSNNYLAAQAKANESIEVISGTVIFGTSGASPANGNVRGNLVVNGVSANVTVNGGVTNGGNLEVSAGTVTVTGTVSGTTNATGGTVSVDGISTVNYSSGTYDSLIGNDGIGGTSLTLPANNANASDNTVNVTGGTVNYNLYGGYHDNTTGSATANSNQVTISGFAGSSNLGVAGGYTEAVAGGQSTAAGGNEVNITEGTFNSILGGFASSNDGSASASGNTVRVTNVTANFIHGGETYISTNSTATHTASDNQVIVTDGAISTNIFGGKAADNTATSVSVVHNNNSVTLGGSTTVGGNVYGGSMYYFSAPPEYNGGSGNTLNIKNPVSGGIRVTGNVQYFQNYNFYIPATMTAGGTMLDVTGTAYIDNTTVDLAFDGAAPTLAVGNTVTLISSVSGTPLNNGASITVSGYTFTVSVSGSALIATVTAVPGGGGGGGNFVPATNITGVPSEVTVGSRALTATVLPSNATNRTIAWSVSSAGTTGASISGNTLTTNAAGTLTLTATIANGAGTGSNYTKDFNITVSTTGPVKDPLNSITIGTIWANLGANEGGTGWAWDGAAHTLTISSDIADAIGIASATDEIKIYIADNANVPQIAKTGGGALSITGTAGKTLTVSDTNGPAISAEGDIIISNGTLKASVTGTGNTDPAIASDGNITVTGTASVIASNRGTGTDSTAIGAGGDLTIAGSAAVQANGAGTNSGGTKSGGRTVLSTSGSVDITGTGTADAVNAAGGIEISNGTNTIEATGTGYALNGNGSGIAITGGRTDITSADPAKTADSAPAMSGAGTVVVINGQPAFGDPGQNPDPGNDGGGGCNAGAGMGILGLGLLPLASLGKKRKTILPKN